MRLFKRRKIHLSIETRLFKGKLKFKLIEKTSKGKVEVDLPISDQDFRRLYAEENFDCYLAFEELYHEGYIDEKSNMEVRTYYEIMQDQDWHTHLEQMDLPIKSADVTGDIEIHGLPADEPSFQLTLRDERNRVLEQIAEIDYPFYKYNDELHILPEKIWRLQEAINATDYSSGYEKTAKIRKLAVEAGIKLDHFLTMENYHYVDGYDLEPTFISPDELELKIIGDTEFETEHLNKQQKSSSIRTGEKRERFETAPQVYEDVEVIKEKGVLKGAEIPQFFDNPQSLYPNHEFQFDLEKFSERVIGFTEIVRPRLMTIGDKRAWFDSETGDELDIDSEVLKDLIQQNPEDRFVRYNDQWFYTDKTLKKNLGLIDDEEEHTKTSYALDIKDNEQAIEYKIDYKEEREYELQAVSKSLKANLYDYQLEGYSWICSLYDNGKSGLLADDMGLGKTMQVLAFLLRQYERNKLFPTLIVLPIALIENWRNEIYKFAPVLADKIYIHRGSNRIKDEKKLRKKQLIFISYDTLKIDQLLFGQIEFECIITDETQNIKSYQSNRSRAIRAMQSNFRLAMTGTPVENSLEELWAIMDFVQPGELLSLKEFKDQFITNQNYDLLMKRLYPFYLRRTKEEVLKDKLPTKHILPPTYVQSSLIQRQLASSMLANVKFGNAMVLNTLTDLRMLYATPYVFENIAQKAPLKDSPKLAQTLKVVADVKKRGEKVLIFTEFRKVQSILKHELSKEYGISIPIIDGNTKNRPEVVRAFNETPGFGIMILSPKAAGVGLTITSANHVIHYTRWWNPAVENQATDRAYRIGQEKDVYVYHIITTDQTTFPNGTVEEIMHQLLEDKTALAENVIIPFDIKSFQEQVRKTMEL